MGGARGGLVDELGRFPEVCKKSIQAQAADMSPPITEGFLRETSLEELRSRTPAELERLGRLAFPIAAEEGDTHFRRIGWDEAIERAARAFAGADPSETFFYASGRSSNEAAFLLQLVARAWGARNIHNCSYYCHAASGVALSEVYGSGTASVVLEDLDRADLALVAGANPASNHPRLITRLVNLRRRGGRVIVVNPLKELGLVRFRLPSDPASLAFGSDVSDLYLQPHIGGDVAVFQAILKGLMEAGSVDGDFVESHTNGWADVKREVEAASWDGLLAAAGVPRGELERAVRMIGEARRGILCWAMGLTHHAHGVHNILSLSNVALARGWLGTEGAGLLPIRGHSNVQGVGSVGVTPGLQRAFARRLEEIYGITVPEDPGQDTYASMVAASEGRLKAALLLGGNLFASNPDRDWAGVAMRRIPFTLSLTTKLNEGHVHAGGRTSVILPVLARDEESQTTTQESMFNLVRISVGGAAPPGSEARSEVDVIASLAERILPRGRFDWSRMRSHAELRREIARVVPGYEALADVDETGREFQIEGRTFHSPRFATPDGKAHFRVTPLPDVEPPPGHFRLMTVRSEGQFNTVVYEEEDLYRGNDRRDVVMMSTEDARDLGVSDGDPVRVTTETGSLRVVVSVVDIRSGNLAMYYPEANAIVPRRLDDASKTPAFKSVAARVEKLPT